MGGIMDSIFGGGDDPPPAPDYTPVANASKEAAEIGAQVQREYLAENKSQFKQNMEVAKPIIEAQAGLMTQAKSQGDDYYGYNKDTFRPIEKDLADEAQSGLSRYNTNTGVRAAAEQEASRAAADVGLASKRADEATTRSMLAMGVNPNSGRFASMKVGQGLQTAAMKAGAQTNARQKAVALDFAKRMDITGLGRGLPGASQGAYGLALNAGNSAVGNQNSTSQGYMGNLATGNQFLMQGQGMKLQGLSGIMNAQQSAYNSVAGTPDNTMGGLGSIMGGAAAMWGAYKSDRRLKELIEKVGVYGNGLPMYEFNYVGEPGRYRGVMADDVEKYMPEAVTVSEDGYKRVNYDMLGITLEAL